MELEDGRCDKKDRDAGDRREECGEERFRASPVAVAETGAELVGALAVIERRTDDECVDLPVEVTTLLTVDVVDGEVVIVDEAAEEESG